MSALLETSLPGIPVRRGKVRDVYDLGDSLLIVATDRLSAFDVILPTGIPDKGRVLTQLSNFWFGYFGDSVRHHLLATSVEKFPESLRPFAAQLEGRSVLVRKAKVVPVECVVRGYLAGGGWKEYQATGAVSGVRLPAGLQRCQRLPEPIFTPTTKAAVGHDESITYEQAAQEAGEPLMGRVRSLTLQLYQQAAAYAHQRGIILADTKLEWGVLPGQPDEPVLVDEIFTPDSSRFWPVAGYEAGREQESLDKQFVRNYLETLAWNKQPPGPPLPPEAVAATRRRYVEAFQLLTGRSFR